MIRSIQHIGLAVQSIETMYQFMQEMFGAEYVNTHGLETPEFYSVQVKVGEDYIELLEPRGKEGLIEKFLNTRGEGIHHIAFICEDLEATIKLCEQKGVRLLGRRFIHPKNAHGVLIELIGKEEDTRLRGTK